MVKDATQRASFCGAWFNIENKEFFKVIYFKYKGVGMKSDHFMYCVN